MVIFITCSFCFLSSSAVVLDCVGSAPDCLGSAPSSLPEVDLSSGLLDDSPSIASTIAAGMSEPELKEFSESEYSRRR